jgi:hypothetical protein
MRRKCACGCGQTPDGEYVRAHRPPAPLADLFWAKVEVPIAAGGCWEWRGSIDENGYGRAWLPGVGKMSRAHRASWILHRGPIPAGLCIDHLCRNRSCVNPDHLEVVTLGENNRRGAGFSGRNAAKTHCKRGHEFTLENTRVDKLGRRRCRVCDRLLDRERRRRKYKCRGCGQLYWNRSEHVCLLEPPAHSPRCKAAA